MIRRPPRSPLFPYPPLSRSRQQLGERQLPARLLVLLELAERPAVVPVAREVRGQPLLEPRRPRRDRKSTRLNSSHQIISYALFCLQKKNQQHPLQPPPLHCP